MTFTRKLVRGSNVYEVRSYRDRNAGRVRQEAKYIGKEVEKDGKKILISPVDRKGVRMVFDSGAYVLYRIAQENGILWQFEDELKYDFNGIKFSYELKHKAIQRKTNRFGYTVLVTNTGIAANELLRIYREKDAVEKSFSNITPHLGSFFSRSEERTRARMFLTVLGYTLVAIISFKLGISYDQALNTISGMRGVVYSSGAHVPVEYTKEQREILEKLKLKL